MEFISNFLYYNSIGFTIGLTSFLGLEYISDKDNFVKNITEYREIIKYWTLDKVVSGYIIYNDYFNKKPEHGTNIEEFYYNKYGEIDTNNIYKRFIIKEVDDNTYFVDSEKNVSNIEIVTPFMGFEIIFRENSINIKDTLEKFCVNGNQLDFIFFKAFMKKFYNEDIDDDYSITLLDNNCVMKKVTKEKIINITNDGYDISENNNYTKTLTNT